MKRLSICIILTLLTALSLRAQGGSWRLHLPFNETVTKVIDTPSRTYFLGDAQVYLEYVAGNNQHLQTLFMYDKEGDEYRQLNASNILTESIIRTAAYNADKRYLLLVYDSYNIDLVYDDGRVVNIPDLVAATQWPDREVGNINFDPERDLVYLSTGSGVITLNDVKAEIAEARRYVKAKKNEVGEVRYYDVPVTSAARIGDRMLLSIEKCLYQAPVDAPRFTLDEFELIEDAVDVNYILPLSDTMCLYQRHGSDNRILHELFLNPDGTFRVGDDTLPISEDTYTANRDGYFIPVRTQVYQINRDGTWKRSWREEEDNFCASGSWDFDEIWFGRMREGYWSKKLDLTSEGGTWTRTRQAFLPNVTSVFRTDNFTYSPRYGMLTDVHGITPVLSTYLALEPTVLTGYRNGEWTMYSPAYNYPEQKDVLYNPTGIIIDPEDPAYVYMGSGRRGLLRLNLEDPSDILHLSNPSDISSGLPGFVAAAEDLPQFSNGKPQEQVWNICNLAAPKFDSDGRMWLTTMRTDLTQPGYTYLLGIRYWEGADRRASRDAASYKDMQWFPVPALKGSEIARLWPLSIVPNTLLVFPNCYTEKMWVINHNGTPSNQADDNIQRIKALYDQDGVEVSGDLINCLLEDPDTGSVWIGHSEGLFTLRPSDINGDASRVHRIKVSRNDGTSLADYLMDGVSVTGIMRDPKGRKWISTHGGGLICVSRDGREVLMSLTTTNSDIPSDVVYGAAWNPDTGTILVGTEMGIAEYYPAGEGSTGEDFDGVKVSPNPVRPDYLGWVTIDGLMEGAVVKIADAAGNVIADPGRAAGGRVQWDATGRNGQRVASGVYHVLASSGPDDKALGKVASFVVMK